MTITKSRKERVSKLNAWLRAYLDESCSTTFLNKTASAKAAKYKCKTIDSFRYIGIQNYIKLTDKITTWFDEVGLSENALKNKLLSLMEIEETKLFSYFEPGEKGEKGELKIVEHKIPAIETRRRTLDMAIKVRGMYAPEKREITGNLTLEERLKNIRE